MAANLSRFRSVTASGEGLKAASVAVCVVFRREVRCLLLTRRAAGLRTHAGQWALPGGGRDAGESAPDWDYLNPALMESGDAWVGVSAQALGVEGGTPLLGKPVAGVGNGLIEQEPRRYGFHATLKAPFHLADGADEAALDVPDAAPAPDRIKGSTCGPILVRTA